MDRPSARAAECGSWAWEPCVPTTSPSPLLLLQDVNGNEQQEGQLGLESCSLLISALDNRLNEKGTYNIVEDDKERTSGREGDLE